MPVISLGESIPPDTAHAVSVSLPTWQANVDYEEGEARVLSRMVTGYPRFFIHKSIEAFGKDLVAAYGQPGQRILLFATAAAARRCLEFMRSRVTPEIANQIHVVDLALDASKDVSPLLKQLSPTISGTMFPQESFPVAKEYWQHTGDGISSRRAEFCHELFKHGQLVAVSEQQAQQQPRYTPPPEKPVRGPKRYSRAKSTGGADLAGAENKGAAPSSPEIQEEARESFHFLEERFGRNLDLSQVARAKSAIRRRIAGSLAGDADMNDDTKTSSEANTRGFESLDETDVLLYPCGMNAIFNAHRALLAALGSRKSVNFGFPYIDTLKVLEKFGPGAVLYGHASSEELDQLESTLKEGQRFLALFCEFPGNPLLACPDLKRIRRLADEFGFAVVVDETIGTFANVNVLPYADIVVSSLTKIFSGDSNVMGGCTVLNPEGEYYRVLKKAFEEQIYEDAYWVEDILFMERNSRDFSNRVKRINANAETICDILRNHPLVKTVYYPKYNPSRPNYEACRLPDGGYGGLLSVVFTHPQYAQTFYNNLDTAKGPSLGSNFTLCSPYVLLAHYRELDWAAQYGVDANLVRVSVGLEEPEELQHLFQKALAAAESVTIA
ncbi:cystathionine beta-lyase/cystathionine gamma-synthase [Trichoderma citrinoviride]|uniref:cystathionine gamma-synthase n=1 Tax=Trichoderma citrinoviride TaxID=58853 RepID=A0A2T4AZK9_9HYPO|nr:cystathionine beta-lyase/cystathionine gamma-synthase [Trichoderma citrinoviride]PTB62502.1 cystathionine beta-lyase/cystathionine gamma-synthase [Trichoderma citrinoviride]